jgi:aryl carrier-like protein
MKWKEIKENHPNQFILLEDVEEEHISEGHYRILGGNIVKTGDDLMEIMKLYQEFKKSGKNVIYALPSTPEDFLIEDVPMMGIMG